MATVGDSSAFWKPSIDGVEILHASFRRHEYPRHTHEAATIALMDVGAARFTYRGEQHTAQAGDVFFINPGEVHTGGLADPDGYSYRVLYLLPQALGRLVHADPEWSGAVTPEFQPTVVHDPQLARLLDRAHTVLAADGQRGHGRLQEQALAQVGALLGRYTGTGRAVARQLGDQRGSAAMRRRTVGAARDYLESHLADRVRLADLAAAANTSLFWLSRVFTDEVGMPPHAYQNARRVDRARSLLADGRAPTQVADEVGFCDQAHFTRVFKHYTGATPRQFAPTFGSAH